jgi:hypothetical protein
MASAITAAPAGQTLSLARPLPTPARRSAVRGDAGPHDRWPRRNVARGSTLSTPAFRILSADRATLAVSHLNFTNGDGGISVTQDGSLSVQGGVFTGNHAALRPRAINRRTIRTLYLRICYRHTRTYLSVLVRGAMLNSADI